ncbi:HSPB1-associated protein 1 [Intoshia linei]|uniref:HSPB1-associated protein 1 n=1 Tax=Intoshia linei TaxID=1819745 RepID=A0A177B922_9BILA|nr:HSPB1-associated protein 1 [Intoshia linei]
MSSPLLYKKFSKTFHFNHAEIIQMCGNSKFPFRIGKLDCEDVQWEHVNPVIVNLTFKEFTDWLNESKNVSKTIEKFSSDKYWAYSAYNRVPDYFEPKQIAKLNLNWKSLHFEKDRYEELTFWIGSRGSYTPLHRDSYGYNLVIQIFGRKTWILFPPQDDKYLKPSRKNYEESSIYSKINLLNPTLQDVDSLNKCSPHYVVLEAGDVLYVPRGWWHFVISEEFSFTINTWVDVGKLDDVSRVYESIVKYFVTIFYNENDNEFGIKPFDEEEVCNADKIKSAMDIMTQAVEIVLNNQHENNIETNVNSEWRSVLEKITKDESELNNNGVEHSALFLKKLQGFDGMKTKLQMFFSSKSYKYKEYTKSTPNEDTNDFFDVITSQKVLDVIFSELCNKS